MTEQSESHRPRIRRIGALLHRISPIADGAGRVVNYVAQPRMVELRRRDLLTLINVAPWQTDLLTALNRLVIVAFPASMSAAVSDAIK